MVIKYILIINSKNQILNNSIIEEKRGWTACLENYPVNTYVSKSLLYNLYPNDLTWLDLSPAVGALSSGSDSGIGSLGFKSNEPDHPIHVPLHSTTTGATAVTRPPAL